MDFAPTATVTRIRPTRVDWGKKIARFKELDALLKETKEVHDGLKAEFKEEIKRRGKPVVTGVGTILLKTREMPVMVKSPDGRKYTQEVLEVV